MKALLTIALLLLGLVSVRAEDWTTIDGKQYPQVTVLKVEPDAVTILYRDGGALIPLVMLPDDLQKRFHYDHDTAKAAADARDQADLENARLLRAEAALVEQEKVFAEQAVAVTSDEPAVEEASSGASASSNSTHHTMAELADSMSSLRADYSPGSNHYSMASCVPPGPISRPPPDPNHHTMDSLFVGDPLAAGQ